LHCELFNQGEQVFIRDLDSLNGTFVDQQRIDEDMPLESGATVIMGTVMFQVRYGPDRDRLPPPAAKKLDKMAAAEGTIRSETLDRSAKPAAAPNDEELWDQTVEEPTAVVSEEESENLAFLDEEPGEGTPQQRSSSGAAKPPGKDTAPNKHPSGPASGARPGGNPAPVKPAPPADEDDDEPFTVAPIDEPAEDDAPPSDDDDMDDFFKSIM
jgi:hypothetical protein